MTFSELVTRSTETWQMWEITRREPSTGSAFVMVNRWKLVIFYNFIISRFSSKTLMSLLPADELKNIEDRVERGEMTVDFYDILGEVQKNKPATAAE